jgi:uracil-DNA glycosylase family 4
VPGRVQERPPPPFAAFRSDDVVAAVEIALSPYAVQAAQCTACILAETRTKVVFGSGSARSGIVLIGEAPGANEDVQGLPFVGRSGQLLDRLLAETGIARGDVYICNVVKCRPPQNRDPRPEEVVTCAPFLRAQLEVLKPRVLCALGLHATRWLLPGKEPMAKLRGQVLEYKGIPTIATYHPAAILRSPRLKDNALVDLRRVRELAEEAADTTDA